MPGPTVFIGSSSQNKELAAHVALAFAKRGFTALPWWKTFPSGSYTLESLERVAESCDFAALVFGADDQGVRQDRTIVSPRGNVIFECGLFIAHLGRSRVLILEQAGVDVVSDLAGVTTRRFGEVTLEQRDIEIDILLQGICEDWTRQSPAVRATSNRNAPIDDGGLGFSTTLSELRDRMNALLAGLASYTSARSASAAPTAAAGRARKPLELDSLTCCVATYCETLALVQRRFWTTTFLDSGFWTADSDTAARTEIVHWNAVMTARLASVGAKPRRIFLLDLPPADYADAEKERRIYLRRTRKEAALKQLKQKRDRLRRNIQLMRNQGCELRVAFDRLELYKGFRENVEFDYYDSELAIYDDFRVDVFGGGRTGVINRVQSYTEMLQNFPQYRAAATNYFESLWQSQSEDMEKFLARLDAAELAAEQRIDYQPNWLARYEFKLNKEDEELKALELARVKAAVRKHMETLPIQSYLDIGTCTARYPIQLGDLLPADCEIIGIDDDADCVQFARRNVSDVGANDRIRIEHEDFTASELTVSCMVDRSFDLITCMLGTLSHFGRGRNDAHTDALQEALRRMASLLVPNGLLLLGTWSESACSTFDMLQIYSHADRSQLARWTPKRSDLKLRLEEAGFAGRPEGIGPTARLEFWICRRGRNPAISTMPPSPT